MKNARRADHVNEECVEDLFTKIDELQMWDSNKNWFDMMYNSYLNNGVGLSNHISILQKIYNKKKTTKIANYDELLANYFDIFEGIPQEELTATSNYMIIHIVNL